MIGRVAWWIDIVLCNWIGTLYEFTPKPTRKELQDHHQYHESPKGGQNGCGAHLDAGPIRAEHDGIKNADRFCAIAKHSCAPFLFPDQSSGVVQEQQTTDRLRKYNRPRNSA